MSLLKQINDKGAVVEWCPISNYGNLVALGTKDSAGSGFDDYGGELELHMMNFSDRSASTTLVGRAKATSRFASIAWSKMALQSSEYNYGLIATGMIDGTINIWDPSKLASDDPEPLIVAVEQHTGPIAGLQFNPHRESSHLLASGGADSEIYVMSLDRPETPNVFVPAPPPSNTRHTADITKVAWNSQVAHILASSSQNGSCIVWDLRQKKAWCELKDPSGSCVSDIAWNPDQGLHLITAGGDDKNPVLKLWDLRSSTSLPLATLQGHTEGILSVSWCPSDPSLLLSCGKDNRTMLWDLFHLQPVYDIPSVESQPQGIQATASADENNFMFNNFSSTVGNRRYHVAWSPCLPAVISTCSFDRSVQFYSLSGAKSKLGRAPKWLRKPVGATFGFGGKLATFDNNPNTAAAATAAAADAKKGTSGASHNGSVEVKLYQVVETPELVSISNDFQEALAKGDYPAYCLHKAKVVTSHFDKQIWELMKIICFDKSAREGLLNYLGFDSNEVNTITQNYIHEVANQKDIKATAAAAAAASSSGTGSGSDFAVTQLSNELQSKAIVSNINLTELVENVLTSQEAEPMIRQALVIGNFQLAVSCCLEAGLMTEALLLAQCGDNDLWLQTQQYYFTKMKTKYNFLNILQSVIKSELLEYVNTSDLNKWKETLAILSTYGKSEEFPMLCERLGARLYEEQHDLLSSTLCYMCAINIHQTIAHWIIDLKHRLTSSYAQQGAEKEGNNVENHTVGSIYALQEFIEKVMIYTQYNITTASAPTQGSASTTPATAAPAATAAATADGTAPNVQLSDECMYYFTEYSKLLASQGKTSIAAKYLKSNTYDEQVLRDRIYHSQYLKPMGSRPPPFPFESVVVNATAAALQDQKSQVPNQVHAKARGGSMDKTQQQQQAVGNQQKIGGAGGMPQATMQKQQPTAASSHLPHAHQGAAAASVQQIPSQQQQQLGQQQAIQQQQHIPMVATPQNSQPQLPPGWLQLVDPSSGRPYYVDQATGQSHWEPPVAPAPAPAPAAPIPHHATPAATPAFQSNPQSVPQVREEPVYAPAQRSPSMPSAASPVAAAPAAAVTSSSPSLAMSSDSSVGAIQNMFNDLQGKPLSAPDKRQLPSISQSIAVLVQQYSANQIAPDTIGKLDQLVMALQAKNTPLATALHTELVNTCWNQHKDWIRGLKYLVQLVGKY